MSAIHQFVAGFSHADAISNEALVMQKIFRSWGMDSDIFCESKRILPELRKQARDVLDYSDGGRVEDIVLLHLSIGSLVNDVFAGLTCKKALLYHNITPSRYFDLIQKSAAYSLSKGRQQMAMLSGSAAVNMADSRFNAQELADAGYRDVKVLPLILDLDRLTAAPDRKILRKYDDGKVNILFVGRCAPNKKIEDALKIFHIYQTCVEPNSRFLHVGSFSGTERYYYLLLAQARELGLNDAHFAGAIPQTQLNAFYRCADVFLCASEHEGFCIPVIESMVHDVPVIAYAAAAVPETMDGAGVLFHEKNYEALAEMIGRMARDRTFRTAIIKAQQTRIERFRQRDAAAELKQHFEPLLTP